MTHSILVALKDSGSSRAVLEYLSHLPFDREEVTLTLLHVFRKPSTSEAFMGEDYFEEEVSRLEGNLKEARDQLVEAGFQTDSVEIRIITELYPTVTEGILDQFHEGGYDLVVIGRREKSKSEEFVMGDVGVKLIRALEGAAGVLVVKSD